MALMDCQIGDGRLRSDLGTAQALALAGTAALLLLPALMITSLVTKTPVAVPAILALGFLLVARAVTCGRQRQAIAWMLATVAAMVSCALVAAAVLHSPGAGIATSALAAAFAAAPAMIQRFKPSPNRQSGAMAGRADDLGQAASSYPVAAQAPAGMEACAFEPGIQVAIAPGCEVSPSVARPGEFVAGEADQMRAAVASDVGDAVGFALRLLAPEAARRQIRVASVEAADTLAAVPRQDLRVIVHRCLAGLVAAARPGSEISIAVRILRGAVLVRLIQEPRAGEDLDSHERADALDLAGVRGLVAETGGTLLRDASPERVTISIRLPRASQASRAAEPGKDAA